MLSYLYPQVVNMLTLFNVFAGGPVISFVRCVALFMSMLHPPLVE